MSCKKCDNMWIDTSEGMKRCECYYEWLNHKRLRNSGLENLKEKFTFEKFLGDTEGRRTLKEKAIEFANNPNGWFYIGGNVGSGKTHLCTAICFELMKTKQVKYMPWRDESVRLKAIVNQESEYREEIYKLKNIKILYIDDLFKGKVSEADINLAYEIINFRYNNDLTTIISCEYSDDELMEIDEAIGSRIYQKSKENSYNITKIENYRLKGE